MLIVDYSVNKKDYYSAKQISSILGYSSSGVVNRIAKEHGLLCSPYSIKKSNITYYSLAGIFRLTLVSNKEQAQILSDWILRTTYGEPVIYDKTELDAKTKELRKMATSLAMGIWSSTSTEILKRTYAYIKAETGISLNYLQLHYTRITGVEKVYGLQLVATYPKLEERFIKSLSICEKYVNELPDVVKNIVLGVKINNEK